MSAEELLEKQRVEAFMCRLYLWLAALFLVASFVGLLIASSQKALTASDRITLVGFVLTAIGVFTGSKAFEHLYQFKILAVAINALPMSNVQTDTSHSSKQEKTSGAVSLEDGSDSLTNPNLGGSEPVADQSEELRIGRPPSEDQN